jgi:adenosylmethionine-8-amino-7-oxononanoate aminotransferase
LVSCVIVEPVLGTGGCIVPPPEWLPAVREICDRFGILLIADEVVCGFGRTGRWFGVNHWDVVPDIMALAKGLTSGYAPMAAAVVRRGIADALPVFLDVHTYGGHPVSAAAALTNLAIIEREGLVENSATVGAHLLARLADLRAHPQVADVRGLGLFAAVELQADRRAGSAAGGASEPGMDDAVARVAWERGLFARPLGGTILLAPPLIFTEAQVERTVEILDEALSTAEQQLGSDAP